jgi:hypothetical protein
MAGRIYTVCNRATGVVRLVRAAHPTRALSHVASTAYDVRVAEQDDIVDAMTAGTKVEVAGMDPEPAPATAGTDDGEPTTHKEATP